MKSLSRMSRKEMIAFLSNHFRYSTMNSWNRGNSYANNVKLSGITFPSQEVEDRAYELVYTEQAFDDVHEVLKEFAERHGFIWQIGFNGRQSGYLVLYHGYVKKSDYKRICLECNQKNFREDEKVCGKCGSDNMEDYKGMETGMYGGESVDEEKDYEDWDTETLRNRVKLVRDFDNTCAVQAFIDFCKTHKVKNKTISVPKVVKVIVKA